MSKRLVWLLVLIAVALTASSVALSRRDSQDWRANRSRRLLPFPWQDAVAVTIDRASGGRTEFRKTPRGEWRIVLEDGLADTLSNRAVDELAALATLTWREPMRDAPAAAPETATVMTIAAAGGQTTTLSLGGAANNLRAVTIDGDSETVYGVNQDLLKFLDWPDSRFRNLALAAGPSGSRARRVVLSPATPDPSLSLRVVLERNGDEWRLLEPVAWPVDQTRLDMLLRWLDRLRADSIEAEMSGDMEWFGLGTDAPFVEVEYDSPGGVLSRRVEFGKDMDAGGIYARVRDRNPVFAVSREALAEISMDAAADYPALWRNFYRRRAVNVAGNEMPVQIVVEQILPSPVRLVIEQVRDRDGARWTGSLERDGEVRRFAVEPPDPAEPMRPLTALLTGLSAMRVKAFLADRAPGPDTSPLTDFPAWRFTCRSADGTVQPTLTVYANDVQGRFPAGQPFARGTAEPNELEPLPGMPDRAGVAFSVADRAAVMEMFGDLTYLLCLPPYRYQSRRLTESDPARWRRVEIAQGDRVRAYYSNPDDANEQWWLEGESGGEPLMDDNNIFVGTLTELSRLRAEGFVAESASGPDGADGEFGLDPPEITAIVYSSPGGGSGDTADKPLFTLAVGGAADADGRRRYALLNDSGPVFLIPDRLAKALTGEYR